MASKFPRSQSIRAICAGQTSLIHESPPSQLTGLLTSTCQILQHTFRDWHLSLNRSRLFLQQKGEHHIVRQVVVKLSLMGVYISWELGKQQGTGGSRKAGSRQSQRREKKQEYNLNETQEKTYFLK